MTPPAFPAGQGVNLSAFNPIPLPNLATSTSVTANGGGRALWRINDNNTSVATSYNEQTSPVNSWNMQQQNGSAVQADTVRGIKAPPPVKRETLTFRNHAGGDGTAHAPARLVPARRGRGRRGRALERHDLALPALGLRDAAAARSRATARTRSRADCTSQDWGVTYDELEPHYDRFEHVYGICGKAGNLDGKDRSPEATPSRARGRASTRTRR